jgi:hypothetical protein
MACTAHPHVQPMQRDRADFPAGTGNAHRLSHQHSTGPDITMKSQTCAPYRGYTVDVKVSTLKSNSLGGLQLRFSVSWSIFSRTHSGSVIASLPRQLNFLTHDAAFAYAERQARRFIDGCHIDPPVKGTAARRWLTV